MEGAQKDLNNWWKKLAEYEEQSPIVPDYVLAGPEDKDRSVGRYVSDKLYWLFGCCCGVPGDAAGKSEKPVGKSTESK